MAQSSDNLESFGDPQSFDDPLWNALMAKNYEKANTLIQNGISVNELGPDGHTYLSRTCKLAEISPIKAYTMIKYLEKMRAQISTCTSSGSYPLHVAIEVGWIEGVRVLLGWNASKNEHDLVSRNAIGAAILCEDISMIELLIDERIDPCNMWPDAYRSDILPGILNLYLQKYGINHQDMHGNTPLHEFFLCRDPLFENLDHILKHNPNMSIQNFMGFTPLDYATEHISEFEKLLAYPLGESTLFSALMVACTIAEREWAVNLIIEEYPTFRDHPNVFGQTPLHVASIYNRWELFDVLQSEEAQEAEDVFGKTCRDYQLFWRSPDLWIPYSRNLVRLAIEGVMDAPLSATESDMINRLQLSVSPAEAADLLEVKKTMHELLCMRCGITISGQWRIPYEFVYVNCCGNCCDPGLYWELPNNVVHELELIEIHRPRESPIM